MPKYIREVLPFLDPKCHLFTEVSINDHMADRGVPMSYIVDQMGHQMGHLISEKLPLVMMRNSNQVRYYFPGCGSTVYRAELFVFTEAELRKLVERIENNYYHTKLEANVEKELKIRMADFKKSTKRKIEKVLE